MNAGKHDPKGAPLPEAHRTQLQRQVRARGEAAVVLACRLSRPAFARALAGLPVYSGTLALVVQGLAKLEADDTRLQLAEELARGEEGGES